MQIFFVRRPGIAAAANELDAALMRLRAFEDTEGALQVRWVHSYALREADGRLGLACLFQADSVRALQQHADATRLAASEVLPVSQILALHPLAPTRVHLVRSRRALPPHPNWLRIHTVREPDQTLGSVGLWMAGDAPVPDEHEADEVAPVLGRIVFRKEPLDLITAVNAAAV